MEATYLLQPFNSGGALISGGTFVSIALSFWEYLSFGRGQSFGHSLILGGIYHAYYTIPPALGLVATAITVALHTASHTTHSKALAIIR